MFHDKELPKLYDYKGLNYYGYAETLYHFLSYTLCRENANMAVFAYNRLVRKLTLEK